jgi:hypothetical protein
VFSLFGVFGGLMGACGGGDGAGPVDGGTADAVIPIDGEPPCDSDEMCNDGVYCNGDETCREMRCIFGTRRDCSDGVLCTVDSCSETTQACRNEAPDLDNDSHADATCTNRAGDSLGDDCDDSNGNRYPGNRESCDPNDLDEDCDATTYGALDNDNDGADSDRCCNNSKTNATDVGNMRICGTDCSDQRAAIHPGATEVCDALDNNCNGTVDEGVSVQLFVDADRDGHGATGTTAKPHCADSVGFSSDDIDCDDARPDVHSAQVEICDNVDNDCDLATDEAENIVAWYADADGDGFGDPNKPAVAACEPQVGRVLLRTDCDDTNGEINPAAAELCDALDNDCNGRADAVVGPNDLEDDDNDGSADFACQPAGADCDDNDPNTGNGIEICDGYDNDCDDKTDEMVPNSVWYLDMDGDGFGDTSAPAVVLCAPISGRTPFGGDCDDRNANANPKASEVCNGRDDNCDGVIDNSEALIDAGCVGAFVTIAGTVYAPQGGTPVLRQGASASRPNKAQGTQSTTVLVGANVTFVHHTGSVIGQTTTSSTGSFNLRVPGGTVFVIVEPPTNRASDLVGSAIPVNGPRSDLQIYLNVPSDLAGLSPTALDQKGVLIADIVGANPSGGQGVVFDPAVASIARFGQATSTGTDPGNVLPALIPGRAPDALPLAMIAAVDATPGLYLITAIDSTHCHFTEGNYFGNTPITVNTWPVRANVITWIPVDCSASIGDCCQATCGFGCSDSGVNACMQTQDSGGCGYIETTWDNYCVAQASLVGCLTCPSASSCFAAHPGPGCGDGAIERCVCSQGNPTCCTASWTADCVALASNCDNGCLRPLP